MPVRTLQKGCARPGDALALLEDSAQLLAQNLLKTIAPSVQPPLTLNNQNISEAISDGGKIMTSDNLYAHIKNIRKKLGPRGRPDR